MEKSIKKLHRYCKKERYKGYNLLDSHTGFFPFHRLGATLSFLGNQIVKRSPLNIRPLIGVKKSYNAKAMALFLQSYSQFQSTTLPIFGNDELCDLNRFFFKWLSKNTIAGYSGACWGYHYDWPRSDGSLFKADTPNVVVTAFVCRGMRAYYEITNDPEIIEFINSSARFVVNDLPKTESKEGICFSYTPVQKDMVFNANLLAAEILVTADKLSGKNEYNELVENILEFTCNQQNDNGSWYYSLHPRSGKPKKQIDFHQGYIVETMYEIIKKLNIHDEQIHKVIKKGLEFYYNRQFSKDGVSFWRYPRKCPVDIHNQSQGIITFSKLCNFDKKYIDFAEVILEWTINNMQAENGMFYYQKWPFLTNKISYMRWNQAWMMLAFATFIKNENCIENEFFLK